MVDTLRSFLESNSLIFFALLILSLAANLFEITGYFREKRQRREEEARRREEDERLKVYEFLFEAAEKNIKTGTELEALQQEIVRREGVIPQLEERVRLLRLAAKKEIVTQNLTRAIDELRANYDRLTRIREIHADLGELPDLPPQERSAIHAEIEGHTRNPHQLPAAVMYRCLILVLAVMLLPSPADSLIVVVLLGLFLRTFFDVAALSSEEGFRDWVLRHWRMIGWLSCFGAWFALLISAEMYLGRPLDLFVDGIVVSWRDAISYNSQGWVMKALIRRSHILGELFILSFSAVVGSVHWRRIRESVAGILQETKAR